MDFNASFLSEADHVKTHFFPGSTMTSTEGTLLSGTLSSYPAQVEQSPLSYPFPGPPLQHSSTSNSHDLFTGGIGSSDYLSGLIIPYTPTTMHDLFCASQAPDFSLYPDMKPISPTDGELLYPSDAPLFLEGKEIVLENSEENMAMDQLATTLDPALLVYDGDRVILSPKGSDSEDSSIWGSDDSESLYTLTEISDDAGWMSDMDELDSDMEEIFFSQPANVYSIDEAVSSTHLSSYLDSPESPQGMPESEITRLVNVIEDFLTRQSQAIDEVKQVISSVEGECINGNRGGHCLTTSDTIPTDRDQENFGASAEGFERQFPLSSEGEAVERMNEPIGYDGRGEYGKKRGAAVHPMRFGEGTGRVRMMVDAAVQWPSDPDNTGTVTFATPIQGSGVLREGKPNDGERGGLTEEGGLEGVSLASEADGITDRDEGRIRVALSRVIAQYGTHIDKSNNRGAAPDVIAAPGRSASDIAKDAFTSEGRDKREDERAESDSGSAFVEQTEGVRGSGVVKQAEGVRGSSVVGQAEGVRGSGVVKQAEGFRGSSVIEQAEGDGASGVDDKFLRIISSEKASAEVDLDDLSGYGSENAEDEEVDIDDEDEDYSDEDESDDISVGLTSMDESEEELLAACSPLYPIEDFVVSQEMWNDAKHRMKRSFQEAEIEEEYFFNKRMREMREIPTDVAQAEGLVSRVVPDGYFAYHMLNSVAPNTIPRDAYVSMRADDQRSYQTLCGPYQ